jgi:hypothetical protein
MKWQMIARSIGLVGLGCIGIMGLPALAQTNPAPTGLNAELSQAVCQQDWARAIRVVDRMRPLTPEARRGELTVYRSRLHAMLTSQTTIPNLQCGATTPAATPRPSPSVATNSSPANNPAPNQASNTPNEVETTIRGVRPTSNSSDSSGNSTSSNGSAPATGTTSLIDRARNLNQTINNP